MSKPKVLIVQELWWPKGGSAILVTYLITKALVRVITGTEKHEFIDSVSKED